MIKQMKAWKELLVYGFTSLVDLSVTYILIHHKCCVVFFFYQLAHLTFNQKHSCMLIFSPGAGRLAYFLCVFLKWLIQIPFRIETLFVVS